MTMKNALTGIKITTDENLMETAQRNPSHYPFNFYDENLALFDFNCIEWHWHTEVEFVYIKSGTVTIYVGETQMELSAGCGIFINSKVSHRFYSPSEAIIPNFLFMPSFIAEPSSLIYQKYVLPVISSLLAFQVFSPEISWQKEVLELMKQIIKLQDNPSLNELATSALSQALWLKIYENAAISSAKNSEKSSAASLARLQLIMQYIHCNYQTELSLDAIADFAQISKSTVLNLFRKYLHTTPVNYLINYRLNEAALLLAKTEKKIGAVSAETGFHNVDYFCRLFKKHYHMTPTQYRRKKFVEV